MAKLKDTTINGSLSLVPTGGGDSIDDVYNELKKFDTTNKNLSYFQVISLWDFINKYNNIHKVPTEYKYGMILIYGLSRPANFVNDTYYFIVSYTGILYGYQLTGPDGADDYITWVKP